MNNNYENTPSFYNNEEYFNKYLGQTSYYTKLQDVVDKIITLTRPDRVLELGSALGTTSIKLAEKYPDISFVGTDIRLDIVDLALKSTSNQTNISFFAEDMCDTVKSRLDEYDLIFLLYSFHHILDPLDKKVEFLLNCFNNMKSGSYLLILETFLLEDIGNLEREQSILDLWRLRSEEGYASTYWNALQELTEEGLEFAGRVAKTSRDEEYEAGKLVHERKDEYLVKFSWLKSIAKEMGFEIVIAEPVNALYEKAILLRK